MKNQVQNSQILYTSEFYTDNDGYHSASMYWTGDKVDAFGYTNGYDNLTHGEYQAEAYLATVEKAIEWYKKQPARVTDNALQSFLEKEGCLEQYRNAMRALIKDKDAIEYASDSWMTEAINMFTWRDTPEGHEFWCNIQEKWFDFLLQSGLCR